METVYLGIGSNSDPKRSVQRAVGRLRREFPSLRCSPVYRCPPQGYPDSLNAEAFLNLVVAFETDYAPDRLIALLKQFERELGRCKGDDPYAPKVIDLDLLLYGARVSSAPNSLPHPDILSCAYVLLPLAMLAPELRHPVSHQCYRVLWEELAGANQSSQIEEVEGVLCE